MEVEEMLNKVREQQGRAFDVKQFTKSCMANVILNMLFGRRFDHSDSSLQHLISLVSEGNTNISFALELCPALRFIPYFKKNLTKGLKLEESLHNIINGNIASCMQVCSHQKLASALLDTGMIMLRSSYALITTEPPTGPGVQYVTTMHLKH